MTTEEGKKPVPKGLGRRKAPVDSTADGASENKQIKTAFEDVDDSTTYFPIAESHDEIEQVSLMLAFAEGVLEDLAQCRPLLRAVIHECDRIGRVKEMLDEEDPLLQDMEIDQEALDSLCGLVIRDELFRVMGEALFRLSLVEDEESRGDLFQAAIDRLQTGLDRFPESSKLALSLARISLINKILSGEPTSDDLSAFLDSIAADADNLDRSITQAVEVSDLLAERDLGDQQKQLESSLVSLVDPYLQGSDSRPFAFETRLAIARIFLNTLDALAEDDCYEEILKRMSKISTLLASPKDGRSEDDKDRLAPDNDRLASDQDRPDSSVPITLLTLQARFHLWEGCIWDMEEDFEDASLSLPHPTLAIPKATSAQEAYETAISLHELLFKEYSVEIPEEIVTLRTDLFSDGPHSTC